MKQDSAAEILGKMSPEKARLLTERPVKKNREIAAKPAADGLADREFTDF